MSVFHGTLRVGDQHGLAANWIDGLLSMLGMNGCTHELEAM